MERRMLPIHGEWKHVSFENPGRFTETYGFSGSQGKVNLEGVLLRPESSSRTLLLFMHPSSTLQLLPLPRRLAALAS